MREMKQYDADSILGLLKVGEGVVVEFKRATSAIPDNFWESYSAFGLSDLFAIWKEKGWVAPELLQAFEPDRTILKLSFEADDKRTTTDDKPVVNVRTSGKADDKRTITDDMRLSSGLKSWDQLPAMARQVFMQLEGDAALTYDEIAQALHLGRTAIGDAIGTLVKNQFIERVGSKKSGSWALLFSRWN